MRTKLSSATVHRSQSGQVALFRNSHTGSESFPYTEHLILTAALCSGDDYNFHFNDEETEGQRGQARCPESHSQEGVRPGVQPRLSAPTSRAGGSVSADAWLSGTEPGVQRREA